MKLKNLTREMVERYFNNELDFNAQNFNLLAIIGVAAGTAMALIVAFFSAKILVAALDLTLAVFCYLLLGIAERGKLYGLCSRVMIAVVFILLFPLLFFMCGGYKSGIPSFFMFAVIFTALMLEGRERLIVISAEIFLYSACCILSYAYPRLAAVFPAEIDRMFDVTVNFAVATVLVMFTVTLRSHVANIKQEQMNELNRELTERNKALTQYDRMKSDFLATIAHEVNTPLAVIAASSGDTIDLMRELPLDTAEIIKNQRVIEKRVRMIDEILLDLMDTTALENGRLPLNRQPLSLSKLLVNICETQHEKLNVNNNILVYDLQPHLMPVWADLARIEQVMTNLVANAAKHTKNGTIMIKLAKAEDGQTVSVTDDGEGMDEHISKVVFKEYVSANTDYWRHGMGLYICRLIIDAHGGFIEIESEKGRGTSVSFTLREGPEYGRA